MLRLILASLAGALLAHPAAAEILREPYVQSVTRDRITLMWQPATPGAARVELLTSDGAAAGSQVARTVAASGLHEVTVDGLAPASRYTWRLTDGDLERTGRVITAPVAGRAFTGVIYGDNRSDPAAHAAVIAGIAQETPDFLVNTGDLVGKGSDADDWATFFRVAGPLLRDVPLFAVPGNHETAGDPDASAFRRWFHLPGEEVYYEMTWGNVRFFALDVNVHARAGAPSAAQTEWLITALRAAEREPGITHSIVFMHQGPFSSNPSRTGNLAVRALMKRLRDEGLDLLVSGHDHFYERGYAAHGLPYLVVGSGGAPLYPTRGPGDYGAYEARVSRSVHAFVRLRSDGRRVNLCAIDLDAVAFDCLELPRRAPRE